MKKLKILLGISFLSLLFYPISIFALYVAEGYLISKILDTGSLNVSYNSISYEGDLPEGTSVWFQIATSETPNPSEWIFKGPDCSEASYYGPAQPNKPVRINDFCHHNQRYFRYKILLKSNQDNSATPVIYRIIISYSP